MDGRKIPTSKIPQRVSVNEYADLHEYEDVDISAEVIGGSGMMKKQPTPVTTPVQETTGCL